MRGALPLRPVAFRAPFDAGDGDDGSPRSLISRKQAQGLSATTTPTTPTSAVTIWDLHRDTAVRRFSEPAVGERKQEVSTHITNARNAYTKAFLSIQKSAKNAKLDVRQLEHTTEQELADMAMEVYAKEETSDSKRDGGSKFVNVLRHYHGVFDVLSQADFSGLPLIWGSMKLILVMAGNRGGLMERITDSLFEIGMTLSRIEVYIKLFPTARMLELASMIYAAVVDFLQDVIAHFQRSPMRQRISSLVRPFDEKFGRVMDRIHRLGNCVQQDAVLLQALQQAASMAHHQVDSFLHRRHVETNLNGISDGHVPDIFLRIKDTLFQGFETQASFHESMSSIYNVTAPAWKDWFGEEQRYLPSYLGSTSRLVQGLCDAPDSQHALQWADQQRRQSPDIPAAYIIWARGMTVQSAIASLIFQIIKQKPAVISQENLDMRMFARANASIKALWDMFVHLMRVLGGCLIYIAMGSVGPDEFAVVEKFAKTVEQWDGPTICVTIIHPYNKGFVMTEDVFDLDGAYDVHPSLTVTDALHHVLMLELDIYPDVSEDIRIACWEQAWREVRYAVIGIAMTQVTNLVQLEAEKLGRDRVDDKTLDEARLKLWLSGAKKWVKNKVASNNAREQIQQHLYMVDLEMPPDVKASLVQRLKITVFRSDTDKIAQRGLTQLQRERIWDRMQAVIIPGTVTMFCSLVPELVENALDEYCMVRSKNPRQAESAVVRMLDGQFGGQQEDVSEDDEEDERPGWKESFSTETKLIVDGIAEAIVLGFRDIIPALSEPEDEESAES